VFYYLQLLGYPFIFFKLIHTSTMFSFDSAQQNSRRRHRASSDDSLKLPKAKRQRSVLRQDAFEPSLQAAFKPAQESQRALLSMQSDNDSSENLSQRQITIRGPKIETTPSESVDGTVILVSLYPNVKWLLSQLNNFLSNQSRNDYYVVSQLPSLPDQIRQLDSGSLCPLLSTRFY
jgi:nuclear pore complex protein Nup133